MFRPLAYTGPVGFPVLAVACRCLGAQHAWCSQSRTVLPSSPGNWFWQAGDREVPGCGKSRISHRSSGLVPPQTHFPLPVHEEVGVRFVEKNMLLQIGPSVFPHTMTAELVLVFYLSLMKPGQFASLLACAWSCHSASV